MKYSRQLTVVSAVFGALGLSCAAYLVQATQPIPSALAVQTGRFSVAVRDDSGEIQNPHKTEAERESINLKALAKITLQQAQRAAESAEGGKATEVKLENEDGNLIYAVKIGQKEVTIDAGNGRVLYTELSKNDEQPHPRSSIQVSTAPAGDGDGETQDDG